MVSYFQNKIKTIFILIIVSASFTYAQHSAYWNQKVSMYSILPNEPKEIIFLGDSITDRCEWFELFSNPFIRNRGLSGDKTSGVLDRLSEITESKPSKVFIMIGVNDLRHDVSDSTIKANYVNIIGKIKSDSPDTKIILQSILPVNNDIGDSKTTNLKVNSFNNYIKNLAVDFKIPYVDINTELLNSSGQLGAKYSEDGLHINGDGYLVWKSVIEEYVNN